MNRHDDGWLWKFTLDLIAVAVLCGWLYIGAVLLFVF
jgi:hypothetical protein